MGPGLQVRYLPAGGLARSCRADVPERGGRRGDAGRHRRSRSERSDGAAGSRAELSGRDRGWRAWACELAWIANIPRKESTRRSSPRLLEAERTLADLGAEIREVRFPSYEKLVSQWIPMCSVETAEAHLQTYPSRAKEYGPELAQLIEQGRSVERRRNCGHSSRTAQVLRQPGRVVWGYRSVADPDHAGADSDADEDG